MSSPTPTASLEKLETRERARLAYARSLDEAVRRQHRKRFARPPRQTVSEWADSERFLSPESSAEPGRWRTDRVPWTREPMDVAGDPETRELVLCFASQLAKTETVNNIFGYYIARDPCPMLGIWPTDRMATTWSKDRLGPMLRDTPTLRGLVLDRKTARVGSGSSEILEKKFAGGLLAITGANSAAGLAMRPTRIVAGDEVDRFPRTAGGRGGEEGDPLELAGRRSSNFPDALHVWTSSPGTRGLSRIWAHYERTDRNRWHVPCPHCGKTQVLRWSQVDFGNEGLEPNELEQMSHAERAKRARYACEHCGTLWDDVERWSAALRGRWIPDRPGITARRGYWLNALVSPWLTLAQLVEEFLDAEGDPWSLQVFVNTRLAELWEGGGERLEPEELLGRLEQYPAFVPAGVLLITAGVDIQKDRVEVTRYGWGSAGEIWALDHHVLQGDPAEILRCKDDTRLDELLLEARFVREDGAPLRLAAACVDSGGGFYEDVLLYAKKRHRRKVFAIAGRAGETVPLWPLRATRPQRKRTGRARLFVIGVDTGKTALHYALRRERPEDWKPGQPIPGYLHVPNRPEFDAEWFAQLAAEIPRPVRKRGRLHVEWVQEYPRAEACDCFVYARAAVAAISPLWSRLETVRKRAAAEATGVEEEAPAPVLEDDDEGDDQEGGDVEETPAKRASKAEEKIVERIRKSRRRRRGGGFLDGGWGGR